jgi:PAS domain S-box-containing protein
MSDRVPSINKQSLELLEAAPDAMVIVDSSGRIVFVNMQTVSIFGYSRDELVGEPVELLMPERFHAAHPGHRTGFVDNSRVRPMGANLELQGRRKNGEEFPVEISLSPVDGPDGHLVSSAIRDVTDRKAIEHELERAREAAENATQTKSRFLAAASHDLRQPLQSLSLYLAVMLRQSDDSRQREIGEKMGQSLETMGELLDALLDISKLDGGSIEPEKRDFSIRKLFDRLVTDNAQQAKQKGIALHCTAADHVVHSDPALLERVIENFVTNAIRYTENGEVSIDCRSDGRSVRISVQDTGVGMPSEELDKIFEEYYQLDNPVRDRRKGLGLGLSIVKHISSLLDHQLDVSSVLGEGSTFSVEVPLGTAEQPDRQEDRPASIEASMLIDTPVVLFVDDDPAIVDASSMLLGASGIEVYSALSGDDALAHINAGVRPDLILSDYRLPGYDGVELIRRIRNITGTVVPTVVMTGDTSAKEIEAANLPDCQVLHKPVDSDRLLSLIDNLTH